MASRLCIALLLAAAAASPGSAAAFDLADGKLTLGLAGEAGYGRTRGNTYATGTEEGQYDNTVLAVSIVGQVSERLRVVGRFDFESEGAEIDWAFAEWKVSDALRFRAGMGKHPFGNYGEILEEGTLRPFFHAPHSIYAGANIAGEGYTGVGITGFKRFGAWGLTYDLYAGELDVETKPALIRVLTPEVNPSAEVIPETREMVGGRLGLETPIDGLVLRLSAYTGVEEAYGITEDNARHSAYAASAEYLGEALSLRAEYAHMVESNESTTEAAYVEAAWKFRNGLQVAARAEGNWTKLEDFSGSSPNLRHREVALGVNYWFAPEFVVKASYHLVDGNRFAYAPWEEGLTAPPSPIPVPSKTTQLFFVGAQFSL